MLDIGAHIGVHSFAAASIPGVKVVSFEPMPDSVLALHRTIRRSTRNIEVIPLALGEAKGRLDLRSSPKWGVHDAGVRSAFNTGPVVGDVPVVPFDDWNKTRNLKPNLVKIDVEGLELAVIRGMTSLLKKHPPSILVVELKDSLLAQAGTSRTKVIETLSGFGYRPVKSVEYNQVFKQSSDVEFPQSCAV